MDHVTNTEREKRGPVLFYEIKARFGRFHASHLYDMLLLRCVISEISKLKAVPSFFRIFNASICDDITYCLTTFLPT
ncbi:hypothetical protein T4E_10977 [Trichinella pseudospiralis]|uniref:Uncharacterized protein n=1 Tax=Trichinella pseudospiralis TaxID=6337 RepID=A0A0V0XF45_TRIPS|nr:hypothetical protein T4E_10977 [Trichinella pseudospiralis]